MNWRASFRAKSSWPSCLLIGSTFYTASLAILRLVEVYRTRRTGLQSRLGVCSWRTAGLARAVGIRSRCIGEGIGRATLTFLEAINWGCPSKGVCRTLETWNQARWRVGSKATDRNAFRETLAAFMPSVGSQRTTFARRLPSQVLVEASGAECTLFIL